MRPIFFVLAILFACEFAAADYEATNELTFTIGYSRLNLSNKTDVPLDKDGSFLDVDAGFPAIQGFPMLFGGGLGFSAFYEGEMTFFPQDTDAWVDYTIYSGITMIQLEARAALPLPIPGTNLLVEPRIGVGPFLEDFIVPASSANSSAGQDGAGLEVHPDLKIMSYWDSCAIGVDASYIEGWGKMEQFGSRMSEMRLGLFFTARL